MATSATAYLADKKVNANKEMATEWAMIEELYNEKLWNELTIKLKEFVKHPSMQSESQLVNLYHLFITSFEAKINPFGLVEICSVIIDSINNKQEAVNFIEKLETKVKICDEAYWMCEVIKGQICLEHLNDLAATKNIIETLKDVLEEAGNITPVHGKYYMLAAQYYRVAGKHAEYYRCGLQFLGCSIQDLPKEHWPQQAFFLGLAALLGEGIYNIGELLAHPILESLVGTENEWLVTLLKAFHFGNIKEFEQLKPTWRQIADLEAHEVLLRQKISLLCLMEMTFKRPAAKKTLKFEEIASETHLSLKEIELLIMKALAQGLIRGTIDQVNAVFNVTWVQPRVLNLNQIKAMNDNLSIWTESITSMENLIESRAGEILTN